MKWKIKWGMLHIKGGNSYLCACFVSSYDLRFERREASSTDHWTRQGGTWVCDVKYWLAPSIREDAVLVFIKKKKKKSLYYDSFRKEKGQLDLKKNLPDFQGIWSIWKQMSVPLGFLVNYTITFTKQDIRAKWWNKGSNLYHSSTKKMTGEREFKMYAHFSLNKVSLNRKFWPFPLLKILYFFDGHLYFIT